MTTFSGCRRDAPLVVFSGCWLHKGSVRCTFVGAVVVFLQTVSVRCTLRDFLVAFSTNGGDTNVSFVCFFQSALALSPFVAR